MTNETSTNFQDIKMFLGRALLLLLFFFILFHPPSNFIFCPCYFNLRTFTYFFVFFKYVFYKTSVFSTVNVNIVCANHHIVLTGNQKSFVLKISKISTPSPGCRAIRRYFYTWKLNVINVYFARIYVYTTAFSRESHTTRLVNFVVNTESGVKFCPAHYLNVV